MSLLLIGGVASLGYWLNRNGRASRLAQQNVTLSPSMRPNGPTIYATDREKEVKAMVRDLGKSRYPHTQSFGPNQFAAYDAFEDVGAPITGNPTSKLTGQPMEMFHANMQPKFGGVKKQSSNADHSRVFETYGVTGATDTPARSERLNTSLIPQNLTPVQARDAPDWASRISNDLSTTRTDVQLAQTREVRSIGDDVRILPKSGDELRAANNPMQAEYQNILTPGKQGDAPPLAPSLLAKKHDYAGAKDRFGGASSRYTGEAQMKPQLTLNEDRERNEIKSTHFGPAAGQLRSGANEQRAAMAATARERPNTKRDLGTLVPHGAQAPIRQGAMSTTFAVQKTKRDQAGTYIQPPSSSIRREALVGIMDVQSTLQESLEDRSAFIDAFPQMPNSRTTYTKVNFDLPMTAREMNADNMYFGPGHTGLNLPAAVQEHDLDFSTKEQLLQDAPHYGNALSSNPRKAEQGDWTQDLDNKELGNRVPGGFAPLGQAVRTTTLLCPDEADRRIPSMGGGVRTSLGSGKRLDVCTTLKDDVTRIGQGGHVNRQLVGANLTPSYPLVTKTSERECPDDRILAPHPDGRQARDYGRLPQSLEVN